MAKEIKERLVADAHSITNGAPERIQLVSVQVGDTAASNMYVRAQEKAAAHIGLTFRFESLSEGVSQAELGKRIAAMSADEAVTGIIVQAPLPGGMQQSVALEYLDPKKDAEGLHPDNLGRLVLGQYHTIPCTAYAAMTLIESTQVNLNGREAVIVGHSAVIGKPLAMLLVNRFATVRICHIGTSGAGMLEEHVRAAEVLIVAVGKAELVPGEWVRQGAIVIDVGINRVGQKLVGDIGFEAASQRAAFITPVPGGVGPLTTVHLMSNVIECYRSQHV